MITVRKATFGDQSAAFELLKGLGSSQTAGESMIHTPASAEIYRNIIADNSKGALFVAEEDGRMVGVITLSYPIAIRCGGAYACIEEFIVDAGMRGKGVGTKLLEAAIQEARHHGCFEMQVNNPTDLGYPLYVRAGIKDTGRHLKMKLGIK